MAADPDCVPNASDAELIAELARRIASRHDDHKQRVAGFLAKEDAASADADQDGGEELIDAVLAQAGVKEFEHYWQLGDLIYDENPYFRKDQIQFDFNDPSKIGRAGVFADRNARVPFDPKTERKNVPKPPVMGGPTEPAQTYYFRLGRKTGQVPEAAETPEQKELYERNILKELEITYGPQISEYTFGQASDGKADVEIKRKDPHIIVLYCGGDH